MITIPKEVEQIIGVLDRNGFEAYLVGGCVRDFLLGIEPSDYDICTSALPEEVCRLFMKTIPTGIRHGTITVILNNLAFEVTTFRVDLSYSDHRRPDKVQFSPSLKEDLNRRDFTMNAIAFHPKKGIIDPFNGTFDLQHHIIRTVGDPKKRFDEDALRMLRAIRFQARFGFSIDFSAIEAIHSKASTLQYVSRERVLSEMNGILLSKFPESVQVLYQTGLIQYIVPGAVSSKSDFTMIKSLPEKLPLRWAALLRLSGYQRIEKIKVLCNKLKMSTVLKKEIVAITSIFDEPLPVSGYMLRKALSIVGLDVFSDALELAKAFGTSEIELKEIKGLLRQIVDDKHCIRLQDMAIKGSDLMDAGFLPGKGLGDLLNALFVCVLQKPLVNNKELLLDMANQIKLRVCLQSDKP